MSDRLERYREMRDFRHTPEPRGAAVKHGKALAFVIQKHAARRLHYDFRLELDGTLKSWAVPKGPSLDPNDKRMAVHVEDHPIDYGRFEGTIPKGQYGAGQVIVWDNGTWEPIGDPRAGLAKGKLIFKLHGQKLAGLWELVRISRAGEKKQDQWLLLKKRGDAWAVALEHEPYLFPFLSGEDLNGKDPLAVEKLIGARALTRPAPRGATRRCRPARARSTRRRSD